VRAAGVPHTACLNTPRIPAHRAHEARLPVHSLRRSYLVGQRALSMNGQASSRRRDGRHAGARNQMLRRSLSFILLVVEMTMVHPQSNSSTDHGCKAAPKTWTDHDANVPSGGRSDVHAHVHDADRCGPPGVEHLSEELLQGLHVLKLPRDASSSPAIADPLSVSPGSAPSVEVYVDGVESSAPPIMELSSDNVDIAEVLHTLKEIVDAERPGLHRRLARGQKLTSVAAKELRQGTTNRPSTEQWRGFLPMGEQLQHQPLALIDGLRQCGAVYVYEAGVFLWPGIRRGYKRAVPAEPSKNHQQRYVVMTTLSLQPLVFSVDRMLSDAQCDWLIEMGKRHMRLQPKGLMAPRSLAITGVSAQERIDRKLAEKTQPMLVADKRAATIERLVANISRLPVSHTEPLHVLEYPAGHRYDAHLDSFEDAANYGKKTKILRQLDGGRNRLSTLLAYLRAPENGGGHTLFPRAGGAAFPKSYQCTPDTYGLRVPPQRGAAILWYNLRADGEQDRLSLHSGCEPNDGGSKWACNMWTWTKPYD
jgi:hypothetical protein